MGKTRIAIETPGTAELHEVVAQIARAIADGDDDGYVRDGGTSVRWEIEDAITPVDIDRRQRIAAAALLMGFDLPEPVQTASASMLQAARILPGMTTGDIPTMGPDGRRACLEFARGLIDEMLAEPAKAS